MLDHGVPSVRSPSLPSSCSPPASPALAYLARLGPRSRRVQAQALRTLASWLRSPAEAGPSTTSVAQDALRDTSLWVGLTPAHCVALAARLRAAQAPATAARHLSALRGVIQEAWRLGLITAELRDRLADLPRPRHRRLPSGRDLSAPEIEALVNAACARDAALLAALLAGGLRREEAARLTASDIDFALDSSRAERGDKGTHPMGGCTLSPAALPVTRIRVVGKGDKERIVYIAGAWAQRIIEWSAAQPANTPLFGLATGGGVWAAVARLRRRAGVPPFSPHDLRRTFVSQSLDAGTDLVTVKAAVGHADPRTTARYDRRGERALEAAAVKLASQRLTAPA